MDPDLAHPHAILGSNEMLYDWDFSGGEAEFRKALALDTRTAGSGRFVANLSVISQ